VPAFGLVIVNVKLVVALDFSRARCARMSTLRALPGPFDLTGSRFEWHPLRKV
jgi:hypothetical protein